MILVDRDIRRLATQKDPYLLLTPFDEASLSSMGYDLRLGHTFLLPVRDAEVQIVDPFNPPAFERRVVEESLVIPPGCFVLGESMEWVHLPSNVIGLCVGRSTYCRAGIVTHVSPLEPGWVGKVTIEISNTNPLPVRVWCERGITQVIFLKGEYPERDYAQKKGRYQNQQGVQQGRPEGGGV